MAWEGRVIATGAGEKGRKAKKAAERGAGPVTRIFDLANADQECDEIGKKGPLVNFSDSRANGLPWIAEYGRMRQ